MIIGTLMFDVGIDVNDEKELQELTAKIKETISFMPNVNSCEEVDSELEELDDDDGHISDRERI